MIAVIPHLAKLSDAINPQLNQLKNQLNIQLCDHPEQFAIFTREVDEGTLKTLSTFIEKTSLESISNLKEKSSTIASQSYLEKNEEPITEATIKLEKVYHSINKREFLSEKEKIELLSDMVDNRQLLESFLATKRTNVDTSHITGSENKNQLFSMRAPQSDFFKSTLDSSGNKQNHSSWWSVF